jgi:hypothetical protein
MTCLIPSSSIFLVKLLPFIFPFSTNSVQVFSTNPKSKFAVFPIPSGSPFSSRQSDSTYYDSNSCGYFGDETNCRSSSKPQKQTSNSYMDKKSDHDYIDKYATSDYSRAQLKGNGSALYSQSQQCNDSSVDKLLSMLSKSQSPPDTSPSTPISNRTYSNKYSGEGITKVTTFFISFVFSFFSLKNPIDPQNNKNSVMTCC